MSSDSYSKHLHTSTPTQTHWVQSILSQVPLASQLPPSSPILPNRFFTSILCLHPHIIHSKSPLLLFKKSPFAQQRRVDELKLVHVPYYGSAVSLELIDLIIGSERAGSWHSIQSNLKSHSPRLYLLNGIAPPRPYPTCGVTDGCGVHWMVSLRQMYRGEAIRWKIVD